MRVHTSTRIRTDCRIESDDQLCHLFGTSTLLNSISSFASDGGLRESASWVSLRQHLYVSFTAQQPLRISLENFKSSSSFLLDDDESWTNRMIYLFAIVLDHVLSPKDSEHVHTFANLEHQVEAWNISKPWYYSPLRENAPRPGSKGVWDEIYMSRPPQGTAMPGPLPQVSLLWTDHLTVVGYQYYHLAKMTLAIFNPTANESGFARFKAQRRMEVNKRNSLLN